jgi:predicted RND superfamily exporter protein
MIAAIIKIMITSIIKNAKLFWVGIVLSLGFALYFLPNMGVDNAVEIWFPKGDSSVVKYQEFQDVFGNDEQVIIGVQTKEPLTAVKSLEVIRLLVETAERQEGVERVIAITNTPFIDPESSDITIQTLDELGFEEAGSKKWQEDQSLKQLLGAKENTALLIVQMAVIEDFDIKRDGLLLNLRTELDAVSSGLHYGGIGIIYAALNKASTVDSVMFIVGSYLLISFLLWRLFGNFRAMLLTLTAVGIGATWLMGIFAG